MSNYTASGQVTLRDLSDGKTLYFHIEANQPDIQVVGESNTYSPDWKTDNLVLTPELFLSGSSDNLAYSLLKANTTWLINGVNATEVSYAIIANTAPFALTITNNMATPTLLVVCNSAYADPNVGLTTSISSSISFARIDNAQGGLLAVMEYPDGTTLDSSHQTIDLVCNVLRGSEILSTGVTYQWYKLNIDSGDSSYNSINGAVSKIYKVNQSAVSSFASYKCVCIVGSGEGAQTVSDVASVYDFNDDYMVRFTGNTQLSAEVGSTTITVEMDKNGEPLMAADMDSKYNYAWALIAPSGNVVSLVGSTRSITVTKAQIKGTANLAVSITKK